MPRPNKINPKKPCPFCGAFLENEAPSTICEASKEDPENLPAGWYIDDKDYTTFSIANDPEAVKCLKTPLKKGGYNFEERKEFWDSFFDFKAPKLRLPVEITKPSGKDGIAQ